VWGYPEHRIGGVGLNARKLAPGSAHAPNRAGSPPRRRRQKVKNHQRLSCCTSPQIGSTTRPWLKQQKKARTEKATSLPRNCTVVWISTICMELCSCKYRTQRCRDCILTQNSSRAHMFSCEHYTEPLGRRAQRSAATRRAASRFHGWSSESDLGLYKD
jgi:hypothetical protein